MILYLDASALVKRYVTEPGSEAVAALTNDAGGLAATATITRAEVSAALARAVRLGMVSVEDGREALATFRREWADLVRIRITEAVVARADRLAWTRALRGYDAVHLVAALRWQEGLDADVVLATYDRELWLAAKDSGLQVWPDDLAVGEPVTSPVS